MEPDSLVSKTLNQRYWIDRKLGGVGMRAVYEEHAFSLDRDVDIKMIHTHLAQQVSFQQGFRQEAHALAKLDHPGIILYKVFTGQLPFDDPNPMLLSRLHADELPPRLAQSGLISAQP
jgi:serine/threonine-protein kinase